MSVTSLRRLLRDTRGAGVIELALATPVLLLMLLGMIDTVQGFAAQLHLKQSAARTVDLASAGGLSSAAFQNLGEEAAAASGRPVADVTVDKWLECDGARQSSFDGNCAAEQQVARFVSVRIGGTYTPMLSGVMARFGLAGTIPIEGKASVRMQ